MEPNPSIDSEISKIILKNTHHQPESEAQFIPPALQLAPNPSFNLSLDHNPHSLALGVRNSIENGIPIPRNMLSHSDDVVDLEEDLEKQPFNKMKYIDVQDKEWFVEELGLNQLLNLNHIPNNTKNVLRNFGNAQNQYILYNAQAVAYVNFKIANPVKFNNWVRSLKLQKFEHFKEVWSSQNINLVYRRVYRELCYKFYQECAIPYVLNSRMKNQDTKISHLRCIYRFLEGIKDPYDFTYFKKTDK